ncbi:hypothetical protein B0H19DRAFT_1067005 [Mycena capillaripes]|nr:hypothetical protein B0H19DRAFT_1067005 [Mycena capillaripes]
MARRSGAVPHRTLLQVIIEAPAKLPALGIENADKAATEHEKQKTAHEKIKTRHREFLKSSAIIIVCFGPSVHRRIPTRPRGRRNAHTPRSRREAEGEGGGGEKAGEGVGTDEGGGDTIEGAATSASTASTVNAGGDVVLHTRRLDVWSRSRWVTKAKARKGEATLMSLTSIRHIACARRADREDTELVVVRFCVDLETGVRNGCTLKREVKNIKEKEIK